MSSANGSSSGFTQSGPFIGGKINVVSSGAQTLQITFIGDNYVDIDDYVMDLPTVATSSAPASIAAAVDIVMDEDIETVTAF